MKLGQKLKESRKMLNWSQEQVAKAIKINRELLSMWENDYIKPSLPNLEKLAAITCDGVYEKPRVLSGLTFNHPLLGSVVLVNNNTTLGRQIFTLAHELCHVIYHSYETNSSLNQKDNTSPEELFANKFAANFLVPNHCLKDFLLAKHWNNKLDPERVLLTAYFFRVSYQFMLVRLQQCDFINQEQRLEWEKLSAVSMAQKYQIPTELWRLPANDQNILGKYPVSVLNKIKGLVELDFISESQAADLFNVTIDTIKNKLMAKPDKVKKNFDENFDWLFNSKRGN